MSRHKVEAKASRLRWYRLSWGGRRKKLRGRAALREEARLEALNNCELVRLAGGHRSFMKEFDLCLLERGLS